MVDFFNSHNDRLKFTYKLENDNSISFLDLLIIREKGQIMTNWYQKPTFSGRLLNFNSKHSFAHKKGVIYNLVDRAILLSDSTFYNSNLHKGKQILINSSHPGKIIGYPIISQ